MLSDTRPTVSEALRQLRDGLRVFGLFSHPITLARILLSGLPAQGMTISAAISATAHAWGDRVALIDDRGAITYAELGRATTQLAAALDHHDLAGPGRRVAIACDDDRDLLIAAAALGLTGAAVAQISPRMGHTAFDSWITEAGVELLLHSRTADDLATRFPGRTVAATTFGELIAATPRGHVAPSRARESRSIMVTSGTTGTPKGIAIQRRPTQALVALGLAGATQVRAGSPTLVWPPLYHGYGFAAAALCLVAGSPMVTSSALPRRSLAEGAGEATLAAIRRYGVEVVFGAPAQLRALATALREDDGVAPRPRAVMSGSDALDADTIISLTETLGPVLVSYYGSTEAGTFTMADGAMLADDAASVGRPLVASRVQVVADDGTPVPIGRPGRVRVRTPMASQADGPGTRWLTMGDLGTMDRRGRLSILGRVGPVARLGGEFVHPEHVRDVLLAQPGVAEAIVEEVPDELYGRRVTASLRLTPGTHADLETWRAAVRAALGPAAVPREISVNSSAESL